MSKQLYRKIVTDTGQGVEKLLGELENAVMDILWAQGEATVRQVLDELNRTRSLPGSFATNSGFLGSIVSSDAYGLPFDHAEGAADRIAAVTTEGVGERARSVIDPARLTWVVVGDLAVIEEEVRALGYGDVEVWNAFGEVLP